MDQSKPTKEDMKMATKYIGVLTGVIMVVGLTAYAIIPFAHDRLSQSNPEVYTIVFYYPAYALVIIVVAGYAWIRKDQKDRAKKQKPDATPAS